MQRLPYRRSAACGIILLFLILFIACGGAVAAAQKNSNPSSASLLTKFHFTMLSGGIIVIEVRLDNFPDTLNFILDTGNGGVSLDSATVHYFNLPVVPSERILRGIGSMRKISYVHDQTIHLPNLNVEHLDFHINDYELLTSAYGLKIDGIVGYSFLSRYIVKVNYDDSSLEIWKPGVLKYPRGGMLLKTAITGIPVFDASITDGNSSSARFYFDTGAGLCFLMSEDFEKDSSILKKDKKIIMIQAAGLGKEPMKVTVVKQIKIGRYTFKKVPANVFKDEYNVTSYPFLGGLIGNDLLRRFNLIINYANKEIHLSPNMHFRESFDYSYTGIYMYLVDGKILIEDVMKDSPGEKAGIEPGDVLVAINNIIGGNIQAYKNLLQNVGARLKILVMRNDELLIKTLKVTSIR